MLYSLLQVHVIEARQLRGVDSGATASPVCVVKVFDQSRKSRMHPNELSPIFDEVLSFSCNQVSEQLLDSSSVLLQVFDANLIRCNTLIGS